MAQSFRVSGRLQDAIVLSSKGVVEEGTADEAPPSAPSKKKFSRVLSSVSLQGIEVDENATWLSIEWGVGVRESQHV